MRRFSYGLPAAVLLVATSVVGAQEREALNELERLDAAIFRFFPAADGYRRIARRVGLDEQLALQKRIDFPVLRDDVGEHVVYVPFRGRRPQGLLFARSEETSWGFSKVLWALDLDLRPIGVEFLRDPAQRWPGLRRTGFHRQLLGKEPTEIADMLDSEGRLGVGVVRKLGEHASLAGALVRSAVKGAFLTEIVWERDVVALRDLALAIDAFPSAVLTRAVRQAPATPGAEVPVPSCLQRAAWAVDKSGAKLGLVFRLELKLEGRQVELVGALSAGATMVFLEALDAPEFHGTRIELRVALARIRGTNVKAPSGADGDGLETSIRTELCRLLLPLLAQEDGRR